MSLAWVVAIAALLVLVAVGAYWLGRARGRRSEGPGAQPYNPSVFVDMDDRPPMEIDFDAGIKANQRAGRPGKEEPN